MISIFLHLLALTYGTTNLAGSLVFFPLTFACLWTFVTLIILLNWLPEYVDRSNAAGRIPSFLFAQNVFHWAMVIWIVLLQAVSSPFALMFPDYVSLLPQAFPMLVSLLLYLSMSRPVFAEFYRLFRPVLDERQTVDDFFRARMTVPILFFPPIFFWMLVEDLTAGGLAQISEIKMMIIAPFFFVSLYVIAPRLFNWAWRAEDNQDADLEDTIREISCRADSPVSGVKIWDTFNEPIPNAAVAGLSSRYRFVYITRYLLELFSPQQVRAVVAHELAHLRLGHVTSYMIYSINLVMISVTYKLTVIAYFPEYAAESALATLAEMLFFLGLFAVSFTALARFSEFQADAFAAEITDAQSLASGLGILERMVLPTPAIIPSWLLTHPQIQDRIARVCQPATTGVTDLIKKAGRIRFGMIVAGLMILALAVTPARLVWRISDLHDAVQAGNIRLAASLYETLPEKLKTHPLVIQESGKLAVVRGSWLQAIVTAAEAVWGIELVPGSEILHHSGSPEVAFDFKIVKFVLKSLDLR